MKMKMTRALAEQWLEVIHCTLISANIASYKKEKLGWLLKEPFKEEVLEEIVEATKETTRIMFVKFLNEFEELYEMEWDIEFEE